MILLKFAKTLSRDEMKNIKAGTIHCMMDGTEYECTGGTLTECTDYCADHADSCGGCAKFPEMN